MPSSRLQRAAIALVTFAAFVHACTYDSSGLEGVSCTEDGARIGDTVCVDGVLVSIDSGSLPDADGRDADPLLDTGDPVDSGDADTGADADGGCVETLTAQDACASVGAECGFVEVEGDCGSRTFDCDILDSCDASESCSNNTCGCVPETPSQFCQRAGFSCGLVTAEDNCGNTRVDIGCGTCPPVGDPSRTTCSAETNACVCEPETDTEICGRLGKQCGVLDVDDNCGTTRSVDCDVALGGCTTGACLVNNTCEVCEPETDSNFCGRLGAECGLLTADDNCGNARTDIDCTAERNACTAAEVCDGTTKQCICPDPVCDAASECGTVSNACGKTTSCGAGCDANADQVCDTNTLLCECAPAVCPVGSDCGTFTNSCGQTTSCGPAMCQSGETCSTNVCVCDPEPDAAFCARQGASCGLVSGNDNCNLARTDIDCDAAIGCSGDETCNASNTCDCPAPACAVGVCGTVTNSCGSSADCDATNGGCATDEVCTANACVCIPEDDTAFCARQSAVCGLASGDDNCGTPRTDVDCDVAAAGCTGDETCNASNTCDCPTPTCAMGACGTVTNSCGSSADCDVANGGCAVDETCTSNSCACVPEDDATFCSRQSSTCGSLSANDNCNMMRTVDCDVAAAGCSGDEVCNASNTCDCPTPTCAMGACGTVTNSCGSSADCDVANGGCAVDETCTSNSCVCVPEDAAAFCARQGADCGLASGNDNCGIARTDVDCDAAVGCTGGDTCSGNTCSSCTPETDVKLCNDAAAECGEIQATDACGTRTIDCDVALGGCGAQICDANACENEIRLQAPGRSNDDRFGASVDVAGDIIVIGAPGEDTGATDAGMVYVYERAADGSISLVQQLQANDPADSTSFGGAVATDGDTLVVGAPDAQFSGTDSGAVYIFERSGATWTQVAKVGPTGAQSGAGFGFAVDVDGDVIAVGEPLGDHGSSNNGGLYVFEKSGGTWGPTSGAVLTHSNTNNGDFFGVDVEVDSTLGYVYSSASSDCKGRIAIFHKPAASWVELDLVTHDTTGCGTEDLLGRSFGTSNGVIFGGAQLDDTGGDDRGSVHAFYTSGTWGSSDEITSPDPGAADDDGFGRRLAVFGTKAAITANRDIDGRGDSPRVYIGTISAGSPYTFTTSDTDGKSQGNAGDEFGSALAISDEIVVIGRPGHNTDRGSVYVYPTE